jgi:hypothetical protein
LKDLIVHKKATNDTYPLILLWLTGLLNKRSYAHLRSVAGGNIIARDINSNTDEIIELVHEVIVELMYAKINHGGKGIGLKHKVGWEGMTITKDGESEYKPIEGNEGRAVAFIYTAFKNILFKALGKSYRGEIPYSNLYNIRKSKKMEDLRARMEQETDTSITTVDLITKLKEEGYDDALLFQYRYIYSLGSFKNFTDLSEEIELRGAIQQELSSLTDVGNYKKVIYDQMITILNSTSMPKINREFLKCYYNIPTIIDIYGTKKTYISDMVLFFEMYPEYRTILKVKRIAYSGKRRSVKWLNDENIIDKSKLYKESIAYLKRLISPTMDFIHQRYQDDLDCARGLSEAYNKYTQFGGDLHFIDQTDMKIEDLSGEE